VWAEEAFSLWTNMWLNLYDVDTESYELIESIRDSYYLVAIIDNDYVTPSERGVLFESLLQVSGVE
jgi:methylenetetrahydrofolate reductase (NADPH)